MIFFNILLKKKSISSKKEFTREAEVGLSAFQADPPLLVHFATSLLQLGQAEKKGDEHLFPGSWQSHLVAEQLAPFSHRTAAFLLLLSPLSPFSVTIFTMTHLAGDQTSLRVVFSHHQKHQPSPALKSCLKRVLVCKLRNCCQQC